MDKNILINVLQDKKIIEVLIGDNGYIEEGKHDYWDKETVRYGLPYLKGTEICNISKQLDFCMHYDNYRNCSRADMFRELIEFCDTEDKLQILINYLFSKKNIMRNFDINTCRDADQFYSNSLNTALSSINSVLYAEDLYISKQRNGKFAISNATEIEYDEGTITATNKQPRNTIIKTENSTFKIFFSWTEDNPEKDNLITIFQTVILKLNIEKYKGLNYELTGTGDMTVGSPNIHNRIFNDIRSANCAFFDTTLFYKNEKGKAASNSNVMFELGYAEALLGENRCVILKDHSTEITNAKPPFDISANQWLKIKSKNIRETEEKLYNQLKVIIDDFIKK